MKYKIALAKDDPSKPQIFETIQGEGIHAGLPAFFIRLQGCNVGCFFCDEKETWSLIDKNYVELTPEKILEILEALNPNLKHIVITGGEPTQQQLSILIDFLADHEFIVHIETAATGDYVDDLFKIYKRPVWVTFSPKAIYSKDSKKGVPDERAWQRADEIKFVVSNDKSEAYVLNIITTELERYGRLPDYSKSKDACPVFLVPDWFNFDENKERVLKLCSKYPNQYRTGIQSHKYLNIL